MDFTQSTYNLLLHNRRKNGNFQYTVPSPKTYPYQWLWDSCFHAIILRHFNTFDAKKEILSLLSKKFENGLIPHMVYWEKNKVINIDWGSDGTSSITQPPMLAYSVWQVYQKDKDSEFLKQVYPTLYHFYQYLLTERDPHEKHLVGVLNPDESGEDNSPRFDVALDLPPKHSFAENTKKRLDLVEQHIKCDFDAPFCMRNFFWVKDVPFNSILVENLANLAQISQVLGQDDDSSYFLGEKEKIIRSMRSFMMEDKLFWSTYGKEYTKIKVKTWAIFSPLFAKILTKEEAESLVRDHLLNPQEFWTKYPVPTVSINEPSFNPNDFWRGPTWIGTNWFIYKGLINYGFESVAERIKQSSLALLEKSGYREYFNPLTGVGLGAEDFTWGGLVTDMD